MVLPDNCLFERKAGEVFELLRQDCAAEAITELEAVVYELREIVALVEREEGLTTDDADGKKPVRKSSV